MTLPASNEPGGDHPYRLDIQGLRAVAVILVVAYHAGVGVPGGFLGVDVFLVVSGYVITRVLDRELSTTGKISLRRFYARRVRRLLPALAAMSVVVLAVSALVLNPFDTQPFAIRTSAAASAIVANVYLYRHVGYFDSSAEQNPFLHTWSLSLEEQFYLVFPLLFVVAGRVGRTSRRTLVGGLAIAATGSLVASVALGNGWVTLGLEAPERFAHFMAPTRAWQFGAGALTALVPMSWSNTLFARWRGPTSAALGLAAIGVGVCSSGTTGIASGFNGSASLLVTAGTAVTLAAGAGTNLVSGALSIRPLVTVGGWSYAWYLWHWPAIVLARVLWPGVGWVAPVAAGVMLLPAAASTRWLERPMRTPTVGVARSLRIGAAATAAALVAAGVTWTGAERGWGVEVPDGWWDVPVARQRGCNLFNRDIANTWDRSTCTQGSGGVNGTVLVVGDQQADSVSTAVVAASDRLGYDVATWTRTDCPATTAVVDDYPRCREWNEAVLATIRRIRPAVVVIANNSPRYVSATSAVHVRGAERGRSDALASWRSGLGATVDSVRGAGAAVVVVGPVPDFGHSFTRDRTSVIRPRPVPPRLSVDDIGSERADVVMVERELLASGDVPYVDPLPILCERFCTPVHDGVWWWYESAYLNRTGGMQLTDAVEEGLRSALDRR